MRTIPVLAALLIGIAGLSVGTVAAPSAGGASHGLIASSHTPNDAPDTSIDQLVLANVSGTFTVEEVTVDRVETDRGTLENVTLEEATVSVDDATLVASNVSTGDGGQGDVAVSVAAGSVTIEEAAVTVNGAEMTVDGIEVTLEDESASTGDLEGVESPEMTVNASEFMQFVEGATFEDVAIHGVSADAEVDLMSAHGVEVGDRSGYALFGDLSLDSIDNASVTAESASVENGTLVLERATVRVDDAQASVDDGLITVDDETMYFDEEEIGLDGPFTVTRDELRIPLW